MKIKREYPMVCRKCDENFIANHLNRKYCSEKCKRDMFGKKIREKREKNFDEKIRFDLNDELLDNLINKGTTKVTKEELKNDGFQDGYYLKKIQFNNTWLIIYDNCFLEVTSKNDFIIHQI